jgi:hypothetical protein
VLDLASTRTDFVEQQTEPTTGDVDVFSVAVCGMEVLQVVTHTTGEA